MENKPDLNKRENEFIASTCDKKITEFKRKKSLSYIILRASQMALLVLSALTTYFIATQSEWELISAVFTTIFTAILSTFKFQEDWIRYSKALTALESERSSYTTKDVNRYLAGICGPKVSDMDGEKALALFTDRVNSIIRKEFQVFVSSTKEIKSVEANE